MRIVQKGCLLGLTMVSLVALSTTAMALCMDGISAPLPTKITFSEGDLVEVLERGPDILRYKATAAETGVVTETRVQTGVFTLDSVRDGKKFTYFWTAPLPSMEKLVVGATLDAFAELPFKGEAKPRIFRALAKVRSEDSVRIDGCRYPVLVIDVECFENGKQVLAVTKYLHVASQIALGSLVRKEDGFEMNIAVKLE